MSAGRPGRESVRQLLRLAGAAPGGAATDRELIARFVEDKSEAAFADLMARHGPMVLAVCRRALRDRDLADDAFQAAFLVLARKAHVVRWRESIGGWLFAVAGRVARKAAAQVARRAAREGAAVAAEPAAPPPPTDLSALQAALDDELRKLPERLRVPVVLCHLEGLSQEDVARHLGVTDGQLRGRLYRAKEKLRGRLVRRGFSLTAVLLAVTPAASASALPAVLAAASLRLAAGTGSAPDAVLRLTQQVVSDMWYSSKPFAAVILLGAVGLATAGFAAREALADTPAPAVGDSRPALPPAPQPARDDEKKDDAKAVSVHGSIKAVDAAKGTILVRLEEVEQDMTVSLTKGPAKLTFGSKPVKADDLKPGMEVELVYAGGAAEPAEVRAAWPRRAAVVKGVDLAARKFSIEVGGDGGGFEVVLELTADAAVVVDGLAAGLADVPAGRKVELDLTIDRKAVRAVHADGDPGDLPAVVKKYDAAAQSLTVAFEAESGGVSRVVTLALTVPADVKVRHAGKDIKPADLKERMPVRVRFAADRMTVMGLLVGDPLPEEKDDDK